MHTFTHRPIDQLNLEWAAVGRSPRAVAALAALAAREPRIAALGCRDLGALVAGLRVARPGVRRRGAPGEGQRDREEAAALVRCMLRSADADPLVARALLQALVPGLVTVARRLRWGAEGDWDDAGVFFTDLLTMAWEVLSAWEGQDRPYAVLDLLSAVRCRMRRRIVAARVLREREVPGVGAPGVPEPVAAGRSDLEVLAGTLVELTERGLERDDAAALYAHRVLGYTSAELARLTGRSRRSLDARRLRAVRRVCA